MIVKKRFDVYDMFNIAVASRWAYQCFETHEISGTTYFIRCVILVTAVAVVYAVHLMILRNYKY